MQHSQNIPHRQYSILYTSSSNCQIAVIPKTLSPCPLLIQKRVREFLSFCLLRWLRQGNLSTLFASVEHHMPARDRVSNSQLSRLPAQLHNHHQPLISTVAAAAVEQVVHYKLRFACSQTGNPQLTSIHSDQLPIHSWQESTATRNQSTVGPHPQQSAISSQQFSVFVHALTRQKILTVHPIRIPIPIFASLHPAKTCTTAVVAGKSTVRARTSRCTQTGLFPNLSVENGSEHYSS